jgi:2-methylcitrate dehydratase PrpD
VAGTHPGTRRPGTVRVTAVDPAPGTTTGDADSVTAGVTAEIIRRARALRFTDLPSDVVLLAKQCLLDWIGVTMAGAGEQATTILREEVLAEAGPPRATLIGTGQRAGPRQAALVNGTAAHALDYDDVVPAMSGHPSAPVLSALLAVAEDTRLDGRGILTAFVAGFETECRVARLVAPGHYDSGWHATGTIGTFGAAAACAAAMGLSEREWDHALGLAATQAAGLKAVFGTMAKPLHAGKAAASGLLAAGLAGRGFTGRPGILEAANGFAAVMTTTVNAARALELGTGQFELRNVLFKYHAACYATHASLEGTLRLAERHELGSADIARVELRVPPPVYAACANNSPRTPLEAKFSLSYAVALALSGAGTGASAFTRERLRDPGVRALSERVTCTLAPAITEKFAAEVIITTASDRTLTTVADVSVPARGDAELSRQWDRLTVKFRDLARPVVGTEAAEELIAAVENIDRGTTAGELAMLSSPRVTQLRSP